MPVKCRAIPAQGHAHPDTLITFRSWLAISCRGIATCVSRIYLGCHIAETGRWPYAGRMAAEQLVDSHLRQLEDGIRYVESTALLIRHALASAASADALRATLDHRVTALLSTVDDQLAALELIGQDIADLRVQAHGSRRRRRRD